MDIKAKIEELVSKIKGDSSLLSKFKSSPIDTVKGLVGGSVSDDVIGKLVEGIKGKLTLDKGADALNAVKGLFGK